MSTAAEMSGDEIKALFRETDRKFQETEHLIERRVQPVIRSM